MDIDLNLLKCFKAVADHESISHASKVIHLSQPAISLQIKRLEQQIGRSLFSRHNRGLVLTDFGKKFLEKARQLLDLQDNLVELVKDSEKIPSGILRIGTYTTSSSYLLADPAAVFLRANKKVSLSYSYEESGVILEKLKNNTINCAVLSFTPSDPQLDVKTFYKDELVFAISSANKKSKSRKISARDLSDFDFLSYPLRYDLCYRSVEAKYGSYLAKSRIAVETESFDTLKQMLLRGVGATFIPKYLIEKELQEGKLVEIKVGNVALPLSFSFITKKGAELSVTTSVFRDAVIDFFRK